MGLSKQNLLLFSFYHCRYPLGKDISAEVTDAKIKIEKTLRFWKKTQQRDNIEIEKTT